MIVKIFFLFVLVMIYNVSYAQDRDFDNDGIGDYGRNGIKRDLDDDSAGVRNQ